jgi:hypothetical protein
MSLKKNMVGIGVFVVSGVIWLKVCCPEKLSFAVH